MTPPTLRDIADRHKLTLRRSGAEARGDRPRCGYADSLVCNQRDGRVMAWCASCGGQPGLWEAVTGSPPRVPASPDPGHAANRARKRAAALRLWGEAFPAAGTIVETYLAARHLPPDAARSPALRFHPGCHHPSGARLPAMVALVTDAADVPMAVHRSYLAPDGSGKAPVFPDRATLGPVWGGAVRLDPLAPAIAIGEGIETSIAAGALAGLPAWAALSAGNLAAGMALPAAARSVVIAVDRDPPGERAARAAADRWQREGRRARYLRPDTPGHDAADVLAGQRLRDTRDGIAAERAREAADAA